MEMLTRSFSRLPLIVAEKITFSPNRLRRAYGHFEAKFLNNLFLIKLTELKFCFRSIINRGSEKVSGEIHQRTKCICKR